MLVEIKCDKFRDESGTREPLSFHAGLNAVLGDSKEHNSIGKSTVLMIIDYCFGGKDYADKEVDTIDNVGDHEICFAFEFNGIRHYYSRSTAKFERNFVYECDKNYVKKYKYHVDSFKEQLASFYGIKRDDITLRQQVGKFFRIYNRNTHNELRPLNSVLYEEDRVGIESLLKMYNLFNGMEQYNQEVEDAKNEKIAYDYANKISASLVAKSQDEYDANVKEIEELKKELADLEIDNCKGATDTDYVQAGEKNEIIIEIKRLKKQKRQLELEIKNLKFDDEYDTKSFTRDFQELRKFFPNEEFNELSQIDKFHKDVQKNIKKDFAETSAEKEEFLSLITAQIEELTKKLDNFKNTPNISQKIVTRHTELSERIKELETANRNFDNKKQYAQKYKDIQTNYESLINQRVHTVCSTINKRMQEINDEFHDKTRAPELEIKSLKGYSFNTPMDSGAGTRFKGVAIFDLTVLQQTQLPAFIHDSIIFNNMSKESRNTLIKLYSQQTNKQIFIAYDHYTENEEAQRILEECKVIKLYDEPNCLFGKQWNKTKKEESE